MLLQCLELTACQVVTDASRSTVRQKRHAVVPQTESIGGLLSSLVVFDLHNFAFTEVVPTTVRTQLLHLVAKTLAESLLTEVLFQPRVKCVGSFVVTNVERIFASQRPVERNSQLSTNVLRRAFGH